jgi:hypothetical protein
VLRQLAFASRARPGLRASETSALIGDRREASEREGITGILVYSGETFVELVEGRDAALAALWRRLLDDDRYQAPVSLHDASIAARWSEGWRAGYVPESVLAPHVERWRALAPRLPAAEVDALKSFLAQAVTF